MSAHVRATMSAVLLGLVMAGPAGLARAAQTTITISTAAAPAQPRIQPPLVVGARPAAPFLYTIPATGDAPLAFSVTGLPAGLTLDASTGIISGTAPAAGSYAVTVSAANGMASASATLTIMSGGMLRPTPPMGWNSYDSYGASIKESEVVAQAQALKAHLQPFGWNTVVVDYRWYEPENNLDANGRYLPSPAKYPSATGSNGFKSLAAQIHALGLSFGIHIMRGLPRASLSANPAIAGSTYHAADAANTNDKCPWDSHMYGVRGDTAAGQAWYDALFAQYAAWDLDFIKIDDMLNNTTAMYHQAEADAIRQAVDKSGRAMVISFSPGPDDPSWLPNSVASLNADAEMWRVVDDFWDEKAITDLPGVFKAAGTWQASAGLVRGHWPDADMLPVGYLGPRNEWHPNGETKFTRNEQVTILSLWSILPSPLIFGGNVQSLTTDATTGPWTLALLTNEEVLAVNQDQLGTHAKRIAQESGTEVWARDLIGRPEGGRALQPRNPGRDGLRHVRAARHHGDAGRARPVAPSRRQWDDQRDLRERPLWRGGDVHPVDQRRRWRRWSQRRRPGKRRREWQRRRPGRRRRERQRRRGERRHGWQSRRAGGRRLRPFRHRHGWLGKRRWRDQQRRARRRRRGGKSSQHHQQQRLRLRGWRRPQPAEVAHRRPRRSGLRGHDASPKTPPRPPSRGANGRRSVLG